MISPSIGSFKFLDLSFWSSSHSDKFQYILTIVRDAQGDTLNPDFFFPIIILLHELRLYIVNSYVDIVCYVVPCPILCWKDSVQ